MCNAIEEFNILVASDDKVCFEPIGHAVVLFVVKADVTKTNFEEVPAKLYAILSLGKHEVEQIFHKKNAEKLCKSDDFISSCKQGYGCGTSQKLKC